MVSCHIRFGKPTLNHKPYICQVLHSLGKRLPAWLLLHSFHIKCMYYFFQGARMWKSLTRHWWGKILWLFPRSDSAQYFPICIIFFQHVLLDKETLCRGWPQSVIPHFDTKGVVLLHKIAIPFSSLLLTFQWVS